VGGRSVKVLACYNLASLTTGLTFSPSAFTMIVLDGIGDAHSKTRVIYDLAHYKDGNEGENWIFRCMLWHVFRYRDSRNKNRNGVDGGTGEVDNGTESGDNFRTHMAVESSSSQLNPRVGDLND